MADWFRWWHGTITDAKFGVISMKANCSLPEVIAVWVYLLEHASQCHARGDVSRFVTERNENVTNVTNVTDRHDGVTEITWALRMRHETVTAIVTAMRDDGLIVDGRLEAWERRQPNREDAVTAGAKTAAQRAKEYRERKKNADSNRHASETHRHASETHQRRGEQIRTETNPLSVASGVGTSVARTEATASPTPAGVICGAIRKAGIPDANPSHQRLLSLIADGATLEEFEHAAADARAKSKGFAWLLGAVEGRRRDAATAPTPPPGGRSRKPTLTETRANTIATLTGRQTDGTQQQPSTERDITGESKRLA